MKSIVAGVDIGGTNTVIGLVTPDGKCIGEVSFSTQEHGVFANYVARIAEEINNLLKIHNVENSLLGVGIGAPNGSYRTGEIIDAANLRWKGSLPIKNELQSLLGIPIALTNDANAACLGEMLFGDANGMKNFVYITLGTGLGSGIVVDGKLVLGEDGYAGELGHTAVKAYGRHCGCGKQGCLETYVSAPGLRRTAFKLMADSLEPSALRSYTYENISAKKIATLALQGDKIALEAFEYTGAILGMKLADVVAILNPEAIFLFGGLSNAGNLIFEPTKRHMEKNLFPIFRNRVKLLPSGLGNKNVAVIGAAALIWQELENKGL
ncbi:MAG: glucokinase [Bacteroidetes bacterium HGW-Bacteroidetes-15]|nr:MAG: glucokinase [Bacteroidetes bacterium HGW-Bacteroidetes-15]